MVGKWLGCAHLAKQSAVSCYAAATALACVLRPENCRLNKAEVRVE